MTEFTSLIVPLTITMRPDKNDVSMVNFHCSTQAAGYNAPSSNGRFDRLTVQALLQFSCVQGFLFVSDVGTSTNNQKSINTAIQMLAVSKGVAIARGVRLQLSTEWLVCYYVYVIMCMSPAGTHRFLPFGWG